MNWINHLYCPLATGSNPIYKWKVVILCDKTHTENEWEFNKFLAWYKLKENEDIFILPVGSIEEYYPWEWRKTIEEIKILDQQRKKVPFAKKVAENISKEDFESQMNVIFTALQTTSARSF